MPRDPEAAYQSAVDIDDSRKWVIRLNSIEERPSNFRDRRKDAMTLVHKFSVHDIDTGVAVIDDNTGEVFEFWHFTHDGMRDLDDKIDPGRELANALVGHRLSHDEVRSMIAAGWSKSLEGKTAIADLEWRQTDKGIDRLFLLRARPDRRNTEQARTKPPEAPAAPSEPAPETPEQRRARLMKELEDLNT